MTPGWICKLDGMEHGPLSFAELKQLATEGRLTPQCEVRRSSDPRWFKATQIAGLYPPAAADPPPPASSKPATLKRAKPLVAPAAVPPAASGGVPVGIAVPPSAAPPPLPPPVATGVAAGVAFVPQIVTQPAVRPAQSVKPADLPADAVPGRKPDRSLLVVAGLSGTCVAVAVIGGALLYLNAKRPPRATEPDVATAVAVAPDAEGEANPVVREETNPTAPVAAATSASSATPAKAVVDPQLARIRGIPRWSELELPHQFRSRSTQVTIVGAWLAADESGRRVAVKAAPAARPLAAPSVDAAPPAAAPATSPPLVAAEPAKYLFVEVKIANLSSKMLNYQGWNAADEDGAILANSDEVLPLVPLGATSAPGRLAARGIPAGGTVDDVLVFAAPPALTEKLRLALPQATLLSNAKGYCAVEIDPQMLLSPAVASGEIRRPEDDLRLQIERDTARLEQEAAQAAPAVAGQAPAAALPAAEMKKGDQPPTIAELNQQIEEAAKKAEEAKPPEAGKMNKPEEAAKPKEPKS